MSEGGAASSSVGVRRRLSIGIVVSAVLVVTAFVLAIVGGSGGRGPQGVDTSPHFAGASDLTALEGTLEHSIYWAGEQPPAQLELTEEEKGSIYLRYLPPGTEAGDPNPGFLTVGTYPILDAVAALRRTADKAGVTLQYLADGGVVLPNPSSEGSVYLAYPGTDLQIEVYDPSPGRSLRLIRSGAIGPVG